MPKTTYKGRNIMSHSTSQFTWRIPTEEALTAMKDLSSGAYKLLIYYYSKSTKWDFKDSEIATTVGVSLRRLQELHKELKEKGYLYIEKGPSITNYFVGRQAVLQWTDPDIFSSPATQQDITDA